MHRKNPPDLKRQPAMDYFLARVRELLRDNLKSVILYGSQARGDAGPESDIDFLLVVEMLDEEVRALAYEAAGDTLHRHDALVSVYLVREKDHLRKTYEPFLLNVRREGIAL